MYRTLKVPFRTSKHTIKTLFDIHRLGGKWITQTDLQKELKGLYPLHSQTIQAVAHKFLAAREGTKEARLKGFKQIKFPWKYKFVFNPK